MTPAEFSSVEIAPAEIAPVEIAPVEIAPVEIAPAKMTPAEFSSVEIAPAEIACRDSCRDCSRDCLLRLSFLLQKLLEIAPADGALTEEALDAITEAPLLENGEMVSAEAAVPLLDLTSLPRNTVIQMTVEQLRQS